MSYRLFSGARMHVIVDSSGHARDLWTAVVAGGRNVRKDGRKGIWDGVEGE